MLDIEPEKERVEKKRFVSNAPKSKQYGKKIPVFIP
jgi:hypothetical protein